MSLSSKALGCVLMTALALPACLGRSSTEDPDLVLGDGGPDARAGVGGGTSTGGAGGKAGSGGSGGAAGRGGSGGSGGIDGGGGSGGSGGSGCGSACDGCCDAAGTCRPGDAVNACGRGGGICIDCGALGFGCNGEACEGPPPPCATTCNGCCDDNGLCHFGTESDACGIDGGTCQNCAALGQGCLASICQGLPPICGPANCGGCCDSAGVCRTGNTDAACGAAGTACENCGNSGRRCNQPGSYCAFIPTCGAVTCASGCCDARGTCRTGRTNSECGVSGERCIDCASSNQACAPQGFCYSGAHCGSDNCAGCCTGTGTCSVGSSNTACGQFGNLCDNCSNKTQTCQNLVCVGSSSCPAPYAGCNPSAATTPPSTSSSCSAQDLENIALACAGPNPGAPCEQTLSSLLGSNPRCYDCLLQFLASDRSIVKCAAPYLSSSCNHDLTCALECSNRSCEQCSASDEQLCRDQVFDTTGQCRTWVNGAFCLQAAVSGPAAFCQFNDDAGAWLLSVGSQYCGG